MIEKLERLVAQARVEYDKYAAGNKAAGTRLRSLPAVKHTCHPNESKL